MTSLEKCDAAVAYFKILSQLLLTVWGIRRQSRQCGQGLDPKWNSCHPYYNAFRFTELLGRAENQRILGNETKLKSGDFYYHVYCVNLFTKHTVNCKDMYFNCVSSGLVTIWCPTSLPSLPGASIERRNYTSVHSWSTCLATVLLRRIKTTRGFRFTQNVRTGASQPSKLPCGVCLCYFCFTCPVCLGNSKSSASPNNGQSSHHRKYAEPQCVCPSVTLVTYSGSAPTNMRYKKPLRLAWHLDMSNKVACSQRVIKPV